MSRAEDQNDPVDNSTGGVSSTGDTLRQAEHRRVDVIDTAEGYQLAVAALSNGSGPIAVDAERASGYRYSQRAYLIQMFRNGAGTFLFDPPAIGGLDELNSILADEECVLHAASQDLTCLREVGIHPSRLFDTELAARLAGLPRVGLGAVVEELLGIHLAKEHSAVDWSTRPLPQSWLVYAALDVELLIDVRLKLAALLDADGKADFAEQEFTSVLERDLVPVRKEPWRRLSGVHSIRGERNLSVARALWHARDDYAREIDTAPGRLVPDAALVAAARMLPESKRDLASMKDFIGRASRSQIDRWWDAIQNGLASTDPPAVHVRGDTLPPPRVWSDKNPEADRRLKAARGAIIALSEEIHIPVENIMTPDVLRRICWTPPEPATMTDIASRLDDLGARGWQQGLTAPLIAQAFVEAAQTTDEQPESTS